MVCQIFVRGLSILASLINKKGKVKGTAVSSVLCFTELVGFFI